MRGMTAQFFFGAMSPYSWFAAERIGALLPDAQWRPLFAGGLFKAAGRSTWGLGDQRAEKIADCEARAAAHGLGPIRWPDPWPTNDVRIARAMLVAEDAGRLQALALAAMRAAFLEGVDLGAPDAVALLAARAGLDPDATTAAIATDAVKDRLRARTDAARALGVFGVPTVVLGSEPYWGDDRLDEAVAAARRRSPPS
jgi:2-hydroxychromene-2-carboxylate isomerase